MKLVTPIIAFLCALTAPCFGCSVAVAPEPSPVAVPADTGTLTVRWLVAGSTDPLLCDTYRATSLEVIIYDAAGNEYARANAPCSAFNVTVPLPEGTYSADVTLVDAGSNARSTTKPLHALDVIAGTDLAVDLDFPPSSML